MVKNNPNLIVHLLRLCLFLILFSSQAQTNTISNDSITKLISTAQQNYNLLNHQASLNLAHTALRQAHKNNNNTLSAAAYNIIALNYSEFLDNDRVIAIFNKAYNLVKDTQEYQLQFDILNNLASVYKAKNPNKALELYGLALILDQSKITPSSILFCKINIADTYYIIKKIEKGYTLLKSLEQQVLVNNTNVILMHYYLLSGHYYNFLNQFNKAQSHYNKALLYINSDSLFPQKLKKRALLYNVLAHFYEKNNKVDWAFHYLQKNIAIRNSLYGVKYTQSIAHFASKIDDEDYKRDILNIEKLNSEQKNTIFHTQIIFCLALVIAIFLLINMRYLVKGQTQKNKLITEIELQNKALELAKKKAEEVADMKSQFISKVSHELRTPLYSVIGLTNILEQDFESLRENKIVNALKFSSNYLMNLINDLLQLQKIEAKASKVEIQNYNIQSELNFIIDSLNSIACQKNNTVHTVFSNDLYKIIETDKVKLNQILFNLLSNALKFTENGQVTVTISQKIIDDKNVKLLVNVADTGIGISPENIKKVFKKFVQFHVKGTDYKGTGLGLSIVKQLVTLLGGQINVTSSLGKGTTFNFEIPCKISVKAKGEITKNLISELNLNTLNILLVENNEINRIVNQRVFKNHNIPCQTVDSGIEALRLIEQHTFDVILTDISMPEINGFEMTKIIRKKGLKIPIIALTAYNKEDIIDQATQSGIDDVITKPFDFDTLLRCISFNLQQTKKSLK